MTPELQRPGGGPWVQTYAGVEFDLEKPTEDMVDLRDIAHATSMLCRFTGHTREFYSVAQHLVFVSRIVQAFAEGDITWPGIPDQLFVGYDQLMLGGLLHDAHEAYTNDLAAPMKALVPDYCRLEKGVLAVVLHKYLPWAVNPPIVKRADLIALAIEAQHLLPPHRWVPDLRVARHELRLSDQLFVQPMEPKRAEHYFAARWFELTGQSIYAAVPAAKVA